MMNSPIEDLFALAKEATMPVIWNAKKARQKFHEAVTPERMLEVAEDFRALERRAETAEVKLVKLEEQYSGPTYPVLQLSDAFLSCVAHLDAAISLLEKGGRKGAASNKMFDMMIEDYKKALLTARAAIRAAGYEESE